MYIEPNTTIKLLSGVKLDTNYNNTIFFASRDLQYNYFNGKAKYTLDKQYFQRVSKNSCRVNIGVGNLYDCNYMMFTNSSFSNRWFYAFITNVEYVNNDVTEITYEIDAIQTWILDCQLHEMYVEREHSLSDEIGDSLTPEPMGASNYVLNGYDAYFDDYLAVLSVIIVDGDTNIYDNVLCGASIYEYSMDTEGITALQARLKEYSAKSNDILGLFMRYYLRDPDHSISGEFKIDSTIGHYIRTANPQNYNRLNDLNGYTPKNKKLFTYPYNYLTFISISGDKLDARWEYSENHDIIKTIVTQPNLPPASDTLFLRNYQGSENYKENTPVRPGRPQRPGTTTDGINFNEALSFPSPPSGCFNTSSYYSILGTYQLSEVIDKLSYAVPFVEDIEGAVSNAWDVLTGYNPHGAVKNNNLCYGRDLSPIHFAYISVNYNTAKQIDDFFTMYGYTCNEVKVPNIGIRPHWNYVKTRNADITGNVPLQYIKVINTVFDKGTTFWRNGDEIGDYSLDNSPAL